MRLSASFCVLVLDSVSECVLLRHSASKGVYKCLSGYLRVLAHLSES